MKLAITRKIYIGIAKLAIVLIGLGMFFLMNTNATKREPRHVTNR